MRTLAVAFASAALTASAAYGQSVLSAHSGVVHYILGNVWIEDKQVELKFGHFPDVKPNETIRTEDGRAEMLLSPGSFLRIGENSAVRMVSNQLTDTRFELLKGEILVETVDFTKDSAAAKVKGNIITVAFKNTTTILEKPGLYQFHAEPGSVQVYEGEALVKSADASLTLKRGHRTMLEGVLLSEKFDSRNGDELTRWSARRSSELAMAMRSPWKDHHADRSTLQ